MLTGPPLRFLTAFTPAARDDVVGGGAASTSGLTSAPSNCIDTPPCRNSAVVEQYLAERRILLGLAPIASNVLRRWLISSAEDMPTPGSATRWRCASSRTGISEASSRAIGGRFVSCHDCVPAHTGGTEAETQALIKASSVQISVFLCLLFVQLHQLNPGICTFSVCMASSAHINSTPSSIIQQQQPAHRRR